MKDTDIRELINLAEGITARLDKTSALLLVLQSTKTSEFNEKVINEYVQTIQDFIAESRNMHDELWKQVLEVLNK